MSTIPAPENNQSADNKKKANGCLGIIVILIVLSVIGNFIGKKDDADPAPTAAPEVTATAAPTEAPTAAPEASSTAEVTTESVASLVKLAIQDNFDDVDVSVDGDIITVNIKQNGIAAAYTLVAAGDADSKASWDELVQNQVAMCNQLKDSAHDLGRDDIVFIVQVLNDLSPDKTLVSVVDGVVYYNAADDVE
jgi:flagellar basal body L-ring protein FlgH